MEGLRNEQLTQRKKVKRPLRVHLALYIQTQWPTIRPISPAFGNHSAISPDEGIRCDHHVDGRCNNPARARLYPSPGLSDSGCESNCDPAGIPNVNPQVRTKQEILPYTEWTRDLERYVACSV